MYKKTIKRRIENQLVTDLQKKMVLIAGPRQCGKTTLTKGLLDEIDGSYYNWDYILDQHKIRKMDLNHESKLWIFDELHKYRLWRNWLKGVYDVHHHQHLFLVSGSAKLDIYGRGGDSLQGRYYLHHLHPFTLSEILGIEADFKLEQIAELKTKINKTEAISVLKDLLAYGGFPEPFCSASETEAERWRIFYTSRLIQEEIRNLENLRDLDKLQLLYDHLPFTVGSPLSLNSLREDLEVHAMTVAHWINILEKNYVCFRIAPYGLAKIRAVKKQNKLYMWDWAMVEKSSARLENLVALHLLRLTHWLTDVYGIKAELRFFRTAREQEVDFILLIKGKPYMAIEVKESRTDLDSNLVYLLNQVSIPYAFQIYGGEADYQRTYNIAKTVVQVLPVWKFLANLP